MGTRQNVTKLPLLAKTYFERATDKQKIAETQDDSQTMQPLNVVAANAIIRNGNGQKLMAEFLSQMSLSEKHSEMALCTLRGPSRLVQRHLTPQGQWRRVALRQQ